MPRLCDDERRFREVAAQHTKSGKQLDALAIAKQAKVTPRFAKLYLKRLGIAEAVSKRVRKQADQPATKKKTGASEPSKEVTSDAQLSRHGGEGMESPDRPAAD